MRRIVERVDRPMSFRSLEELRGSRGDGGNRPLPPEVVLAERLREEAGRNAAGWLPNEAPTRLRLLLLLPPPALFGVPRPFLPRLFLASRHRCLPDSALSDSKE